MTTPIVEREIVERRGRARRHRRPAPCRRRRRTDVGSTRRSSTCRCPTTRPSATTCPGCDRERDVAQHDIAATGVERRHLLERCERDLVGGRVGERHPVELDRDRAGRHRGGEAGSSISGSRSDTSNTRSKLTNAAIASTRALAKRRQRCVELASSNAIVTTVPGLEIAADGEVAAEAVDQCQRERRHQAPAPS